MNRTIKFRGKSLVDIGNIKKGDWVYGGITYNDDRFWIDIPYIGQVLVDKETIGQFTGLYDKNGEEIYEGDIVVDKEDEVIGKITWNEEEASFYFSILYENGTYEEEKLNDWASVLEVIGNIYDNPELLGGE